MSSDTSDDTFFIGWSGRTGQTLGRFLLTVAALLMAATALLGLGLGATTDDPAGSILRLGDRAPDGGPAPPGEWGDQQTFRGHLSRIGYPLLHLPPDTERPQGRVLLLSGDGKRGLEGPWTPGPVVLTGNLLRRGTIEMLVVDGPPETVGDDAASRPAPHQPLGRWRVVGEICDGKCYAGAMRPGSGIAHRACANLCLFGEVPAIFVTAAPVAGSSFLVLAGMDGGPPSRSIADVVGIPVELEGDVDRVGNLLVFRLDMSRIRRL